MRVPLQGGSPQVVLQWPYIHNIQCARSPSKLCLVATLERSTAKFFILDPEDGTTQEFVNFKVGKDFNWRSLPGWIATCAEPWRAGAQCHLHGRERQEHSRGRAEPMVSHEHRLGCRWQKRTRVKPDSKRSARDVGRGAQRQPSSAAARATALPSIGGPFRRLTGATPRWKKSPERITSGWWRTSELRSAGRNKERARRWTRPKGSSTPASLTTRRRADP